MPSNDVHEPEQDHQDPPYHPVESSHEIHLIQKVKKLIPEGERGKVAACAVAGALLIGPMVSSMIISGWDKDSPIPADDTPTIPKSVAEKFTSSGSKIVSVERVNGADCSHNSPPIFSRRGFITGNQHVTCQETYRVNMLLHPVITFPNGLPQFQATQTEEPFSSLLQLLSAAPKAPNSSLLREPLLLVANGTTKVNSDVKSHANVENVSITTYTSDLDCTTDDGGLGVPSNNKIAAAQSQTTLTENSLKLAAQSLSAPDNPMKVTVKKTSSLEDILKPTEISVISRLAQQGGYGNRICTFLAAAKEGEIDKTTLNNIYGLIIGRARTEVSFDVTKQTEYNHLNTGIYNRNLALAWLACGYAGWWLGHLWKRTVEE